MESDGGGGEDEWRYGWTESDKYGRGGGRGYMGEGGVVFLIKMKFKIKKNKE